MISFLISSSSDICGQFQSPAVKSERGPRSAEPYNATLLIGMSIILSFCNVCCSTFIFELFHNGGMMEVGATDSPDWVASRQIVGAYASVIFPCTSAEDGMQ